MRHPSGTFARTRRQLACVTAALVLSAASSSRVSVAAAATTPALPEKLTDAEFWKLLNDISEPDGYFQIEDNFTSNEREVAEVFTRLRARKITGDVYVGVGPEQNLTYIASIRPKMAFIIDIRRQAVMQHLMFKAMFELAKDRSEFISLLFGRKQPRQFDAATTIQAIWSEYIIEPHDSALQTQTFARVSERLTKTHGFTFTPDETRKLTHVFEAFQAWGPEITTRAGTVGRGGGNADSFRSLTGTATDNVGQVQSFLATEENFQFVKTLHEKNLIVPVSGDFAGPKALRGIGAYVKEKGSLVRAYYVSNVEQYLFRENKQRAFYENVATLPVDSTSVFIRPYALRGGRGGGPFDPLCPIAAFVRAALGGRVFDNNAATACAN